MNVDGEVDSSTLSAPKHGARRVIVLPARNESALLPSALQALGSSARWPSGTK